jgi:hypothetical protein
MSGCDDSGVTSNTDTNVVVYKNLILTLLFNDSSGSVLEAANLWSGLLVAGNSSAKDIYLSRPANDPSNSFINSGHLYPGAPGMQTRFNRLYPDLGSESNFDSLSIIPVANALDSTAFIADDTYDGGAWGYFTINQSAHPVFSFYLKGKYAAGQTNGNRIYGVFYVRSVSAVTNGVQVAIDVKYNKIGANHFKQ